MHFQSGLAEISCVLNVDVKRGTNWLNVSWTNPREVKGDDFLGFLILLKEVKSPNQCQLFWRVSRILQFVGMRHGIFLKVDSAGQSVKECASDSCLKLIDIYQF